jgi:hypothetical protein
MELDGAREVGLQVQVSGSRDMSRCIVVLPSLWVFQRIATINDAQIAIAEVVR